MEHGVLALTNKAECALPVTQVEINELCGPKQTNPRTEAAVTAHTACVNEPSVYVAQRLLEPVHRAVG